MSEEKDELGPFLELRLNRSVAVARAQLQMADGLVHEAGVGGKHPKREELVIALAQVLATNFLALAPAP